MDFVILILAVCVLCSTNRGLAILLAFFALVTACDGKIEAAEPTRFEISIVLENDSDMARIDAAVSQAADIFRNDLAIDIVPVYFQTASVAEHTKAEALLTALQSFRMANPQHSNADATVLFTRRELTRGYDGFATAGPACSAGASAIVELHGDGLDGEVLAHELLHTIGVQHDSDSGWLMSEALSRTGNNKLSPLTFATVKAAPLDCMRAIEPRASATSVGTPQADGGGGSFGISTLACLVGLLIWRIENACSRLVSRVRRGILRLFSYRD